MSRSLLRSSNGAAFWCGPNIYILQMGPASVGSKWWLTNGFRDTPWYPYDTLFSDKPSWVASWYTSDSKLPKWCQNHPNTIIRHHPKPSLNDAKIMPKSCPILTHRLHCGQSRSCNFESCSGSKLGLTPSNLQIWSWTNDVTCHVDRTQTLAFDNKLDIVWTCLNMSENTAVSPAITFIYFFNDFNWPQVVSAPGFESFVHIFQELTRTLRVVKQC